MRLFILLVLLVNLNFRAEARQQPVQKKPVLYAMYDVSDSGTSMTLERAYKNAEEAENKKTRQMWMYSGIYVVLLTGFGIWRWKSRKTAV